VSLKLAEVMAIPPIEIEFVRTLFSIAERQAFVKRQTSASRETFFLTISRLFQLSKV
jgi:hypothetical protein